MGDGQRQAPYGVRQRGDHDQVERGSEGTENGQRHAPGERQRSRQGALCVLFVSPRWRNSPRNLFGLREGDGSTQQSCKRHRGGCEAVSEGSSIAEISFRTDGVALPTGARLSLAGCVLLLRVNLLAQWSSGDARTRPVSTLS